MQVHTYVSVRLCEKKAPCLTHRHMRNRVRQQNLNNSIREMRTDQLPNSNQDVLGDLQPHGLGVTSLRLR